MLYMSSTRLPRDEQLPPTDFSTGIAVALDLIPRRRVLLADNNTDFSQVFGEIMRLDPMLEFIGYVTSGAAALERVQHEPVDVLVLDLGLEDCHGFDVLERLRSQGSRTKVVVHSGHTAPELAAHAKRKGADAYVVKDGDAEALLSVIREI
jgi:DNA-binding NarL/FixJ family response regulator